MKLPQMTDVHHLFNPAIAPPLVSTKTGSHPSHLASLHSRCKAELPINSGLFFLDLLCVCAVITGSTGLPGSAGNTVRGVTRLLKTMQRKNSKRELISMPANFRSGFLSRFF